MKKFAIFQIFTTISMIATACTTNTSTSGATTNKPKSPTKNINDVSLKIKPNPDLDFGFGIKASDLKIDNVLASFTNPLDAGKYNFQLENTKPVLENGDNVSDQKAQIYFHVKISEKNNPANFIYKDILVHEGLTSSFDGKIDQKVQARFGPSEGVLAYSKKSRYDQFLEDNARYLTALKRAIAFNLLDSRDGSFDISKFRVDVQTTATNKQLFDEQAKQLKLNTYDDSLVKGFGVPVYGNSHDDVKGINLYHQEMNKFPGWRDIYGRDEYKTDGLPRVLPNELYKQIALQTYSIAIHNDDPKKTAETGKASSRATNGTAWILDYKPVSGEQKYPTTWYLGTNLHVADAISNNTHGIGFTIIKDKVAVRSRIEPAGGANSINFDNYYVPFLEYTNQGAANNDQNQCDPAGIRTVFSADDYLTQDPKDYLVAGDELANYKEFLDFAVIEVDFQALWSKISSTEDNYSNTHGHANAEAYARDFTRNYANLDESKQTKFLQKSYLQDYKRVDYPLFNHENPGIKPDLTKFDTFYLLGYPSSKGDWGFHLYEDHDHFKNRDFTVSLWVNGEGGWFGDPEASMGEQYKKTVGDQLSTNVGYQTFGDKPGVIDGFLSASRAGKELYADANHRNGAKLINFGLEYTPRHYAPYGGSSGSSMRNQKNELVGVFHVGNNTAKVGLAAAFRSEGFDYQGLYGRYKLPQYDLIYGGGADQQKSYRQSLQALYGDSYTLNCLVILGMFPKSLSLQTPDLQAISPANY